MDNYEQVKIMEFPGMIVRVHSPILDEKEHNRRMKIIQKQAEKLLKAKEG